MAEIGIEIAGRKYDNVLNASVIKSLETLSGNFSFSFTINTISEKRISDLFPIKQGDVCKITIGKHLIITGYIENISINYNNTVHIINIQGRDKTCDVGDSDVYQNIKFSPPITLKQTIERILQKQNITGIKVIDNINPDVFTSGDTVNAEIGENVWDLINKYCLKRQVFATTNGDGNIVLLRSDSAKEIKRFLLHEVINTQGELNNILSAYVEYDDTQRFYKYIIKSTENPTALNKGGGIFNYNTMTNITGTALDKQVRQSRIKVITSEENINTETANKRAIWEANIKNSRAFNYICNVAGFYYNEDNIWKPNLLVNVVDDYCDIISLLLLKRCVYNLSLDGGSTTELTFGLKNSFTLETELKARDRGVNITGKNL